LNKKNPFSEVTLVFQQIAALFDGTTIKMSNCEYAGNNSWYVIFGSESDAQAAHRHLLENVQKFNGKAICVNNN